MTGNCWLHPKPGKHGYASCHRMHGARYVHRAVFLAVYGYLPEVVMHRCDTRHCYNPAHLLPGTQKLNMQDMYAKGRAADNTLNHNMPQPVRCAAYYREMGRRQRNGTWVYR